MFRAPSERERRSGKDLIGKKVQIYWDGDNKYYAGIVMGYTPGDEDGAYKVQYTDRKIHKENLGACDWLIWDEKALFKPLVEINSNFLFN